MDLRDKFQTRLNAPMLPPLDATAKFLRIYCADAADMEEIRQHLTRMAAINQRTILQGISGIEALIDSPPSENGTLADLVSWEANWVLEQPDDEGAKDWLRTILQLAQDVLKSQQSAH
jgi:hypothetical protein